MKNNLIIQFINLHHADVFKKYSSRYNIYRELYEKDLFGLEIRNVDFKLGQRIKKIILSNKEICYLVQTKDPQLVDILSLGTLSIFKELAKEIIAIGNEDIGFKINKVIQNIIDYDTRNIQIGNKNFEMNKAHLVGILNVTPDSFSDGGKYYEKNAAVEHALKLLEEGAEIIDIGGESSRPGAMPISESEEEKRVLPVIEEILKIKPDAIISVDTTKSKVADSALSIGAKIINDISSFNFDPNMLDIVKKHNATYVLMHMKGNPQTMQDNPYYEDVVSELYEFFICKINETQKGGIKNILIDPGIGFGKRVLDNYELIRRLNEFKGLGFPIYIGLSRKSFLGKALNLGIDEREEATLIAETIAIQNGARFIRTHNVKNARYASLINQFIDKPELLNNV
ncbi:dihydropteroate synthase [Rosettibacter firmus]|uniref:dihydropteroate synthase n=1 Tax=Rosettibacter firmus TaxID=3111522 RepID=UPI00336C2839